MCKGCTLCKYSLYLVISIKYWYHYLRRIMWLHYFIHHCSRLLRPLLSTCGILHMQQQRTVCIGAQLFPCLPTPCWPDLNLNHLRMLITYICKDKNNNVYYVNNITVVLTHVLAPPTPLGSRLRDLKTIPPHIHFPNEVFHLLWILPIL